jgi:hypothetical protein
MLYGRQLAVGVQEGTIFIGKSHTLYMILKEMGHGMARGGQGIE